MSLFLANPDTLVLLLVAGILLIYAEFNMPGTVIPGALGVLCTMLALFGLSQMPISGSAVGLLALGLGVILLELKVQTHGVLGVAGTLALVWGLLHLVEATDGVHLATAIAAGLAFSTITLFLGFMAMTARQNKFLLGPQAMVGKAAVAATALSPGGQVEVRGELWQATLAGGEGHVAAGAPLVVKAVDGLHLLVQPAGVN